MFNHFNENMPDKNKYGKVCSDELHYPQVLMICLQPGENL